MSQVDIIEVVDDSCLTEIVVSQEATEVVERGPQGPSGISIPTSIVDEFPASPIEGTLYIKV